MDGGRAQGRPVDADGGLLSDSAIVQAVSRILLRSERQNAGSLERTYVETGVLAQLDNFNSQVLYGRRGTGKSHVMQVLGLRRERVPANVAVYIDLRALGSALAVADSDRPFQTRCINLFKDLLIAVRDRLLELVADSSRERSEDAVAALNDFTDAIASIARVTQTSEVSRERSAESSASGAATFGVDGFAPKASIGMASETAASLRVAETYKQVFENNLVFSEVKVKLEAVLTGLGVAGLFLLLDEWSGVPVELQPYLAEFIKRSLMPSPRVTVKIASLEYRSRLSHPLELNTVVGFEVGGDISATLDLDDYFVYDRNPDQVVAAFEQLLFKHVSNELPDGYLDSLGLAFPPRFRQRLFSEAATFVELVRASEGVVRDFINIFNTAFFDSLRRGRASIDVKAVREAARKWYETDKAVNLSPAQHKVLNRIVTEVIGNKRARSFLLEREHARHPMVQSLFDFRVLHLISKGYSDKENPGVRYNIYTLDYGTYVDLIQTKAQPDLGLFETDETDRVVPFDDKRSIRRIVVGPDILE